jgi:hypothetical protein
MENDIERIPAVLEGKEEDGGNPQTPPNEGIYNSIEAKGDEATAGESLRISMN